MGGFVRGGERGRCTWEVTLQSEGQGMGPQVAAAIVLTDPSL